MDTNHLIATKKNCLKVVLNPQKPKPGTKTYTTRPLEMLTARLYFFPELAAAPRLQTRLTSLSYS